jgi:hypothetical protein
MEEWRFPIFFFEKKIEFSLVFFFLGINRSWLIASNRIILLFSALCIEVLRAFPSFTLFEFAGRRRRASSSVGKSEAVEAAACFQWVRVQIGAGCQSALRELARQVHAAGLTTADDDDENAVAVTWAEQKMRQQHKDGHEFFKAWLQRSQMRRFRWQTAEQKVMDATHSELDHKIQLLRRKIVSKFSHAIKFDSISGLWKIMNNFWEI